MDNEKFSKELNSRDCIATFMVLELANAIVFDEHKDAQEFACWFRNAWDDPNQERITVHDVLTHIHWKPRFKYDNFGWCCKDELLDYVAVRAIYREDKELYAVMLPILEIVDFSPSGEEHKYGVKHLDDPDRW